MVAYFLGMYKKCQQYGIMISDQKLNCVCQNIIYCISIVDVNVMVLWSEYLFNDIGQN